VHVHVERPKPRKKRTSKPKEQSMTLSKPSNISSSISSGLIHTRGQINNEQATIIQQIQAPPDPRIDKLEKRSLKIKAYLKGNKGESKTNPINVESPSFQDAFETPLINSRLVSEKTVEPKKINFEKVNLNSPEKSKQKYSLLSLFSRTPKEKKINMPKKDSGTSPSEPLLTLEYRPSKPSATAPSFMETQTTTTEMQTTPIKTGTDITKQLKNLVNEMHLRSPNKKIAMAQFRSEIAKKLKELGVESSHTNTYVTQMRRFYDVLWDGSNEIMPI
jgi:hypothetical protein